MGPFQPHEEITQSEAISRRLYCIGTYDALGRLVAIEKRSDGDQIFLFRYGYDDDGSRFEIRTDEEGKPRPLPRRYPGGSV